MRKTKLLALFALVLAMVTALTSCGSVASIDDILNTEYNVSEDVYTKDTVLSELTGYAVVSSNDEFVLFTSAEGTSISYKVLSLRTGKVVGTFADTAFTFVVNLIDEVPAFSVIKTEVPAEGAEPTAEPEVKYSLYDATGKEVVTTKYEAKAPFMLTEDVLVYDYATYTVAEDGALTKKDDVPEYVLIDELDYYTDEYYYVMNDSKVEVYDHSFNLVSTYFAPAYAEVGAMAVLNNGDIFVQYTYEVDEDSKKYDIDNSEDGESQKLKLVSLVVSAKNGKTTNVKLDYIVGELYSNYELKSYSDNEDVYSDKFDNLAVIAPIVDKKVDYSEATLDLVTMNNKGKIGKSLKIVDNQNASVAQKIADDRYMVYTVAGGYVVVNAKGDVIKNLNSRMRVVGDYFVGERAIYDMDFNKVYDLVEKEAFVLGTVANTVFVQAETDTGYDVISFCDGKQTTVHSYKDDGTTTAVFAIVNGIGYSIIDSASGDHKYYNANGDLITTTSYAITVVTVAEDVVLLMGTNEGKATYHVFTLA